ncbi:hypothetical protein [Spirosoma endophyticum]|uniref:Uncharacterized protein n=1 Tax=Spirosoma endophyticum TaxID=662367 RepID=A0A1I2H8E1_9BACT|nr:hypothetical protein [Spirosoma endophyticum]SFF25016.1 hypothetical protein SAMN05216167_13822 [Spirosoma endophyticum]
MDACAIEYKVDYGVIAFVNATHTKSSYSGLPLLPHERTTKTLLRPFSDPKIDALKARIKSEIERYPQYLPEDAENIQDLVNDMAGWIASIEFEKVAIELTPSSTLKFKFLLESDRQLIITKPLDKNELAKDEVFFSLFFNKELLVSDVKNVYELVQGLNKFNKNQAFLNK